MQSYDSKIPKFSGQLALHKLPTTNYIDFSDENYTFEQADVDKPCTLSAEKKFTGPLGRLQHGELDMRWVMYQHDDVNGTVEHKVGRVYELATNGIKWTAVNTVGYGNAKLTPSPAIAPAGNELISKDINSVITAIRAHFMDAPTKETAVTPAVRNNLRHIMGRSFNVLPLLYRLAILWHTACWVESTGATLRSTMENANLAKYNSCVDLTGYINALKTSAEIEHNPVMINMDEDMVQMTESLAILRFACSDKWSTNIVGDLPAMYKDLPPMPNVTIYNSGIGPAGECVPTILQSHAVWDVAAMYAGQHGVVSQWLSAVKTVGLLWCSPVGGRSAIMLSSRIELNIPAMRSSATVLLPMSADVTHWMSDNVEVPEPDFAKHLLDCNTESIMLGCSVRMVGMLSGMPIAMYMVRANAELQAMTRGLCRIGAMHSKVMMQAAHLFRRLGGMGNLGFVLASLSPNYKNQDQVVTWWNEHEFAYQWDEVACVLDKLPDNSCMSGVFDPLLTTQVAVVNKWYGVQNSIAQRCSTPHAMQRLVYKPQVDVGVAVTAAVDGSRSIYNYELKLGYREQYSDWMFFGPFMRKAAAAELVFRVRSGETALELATGPVGYPSRKYYVGLPNQEDDLPLDLLNDHLDFDLGPVDKPNLFIDPHVQGALQHEDGEHQDATMAGDVRLISALAGVTSSQPLPPAPASKLESGKAGGSTLAFEEQGLLEEETSSQPPTPSKPQTAAQKLIAEGGRLPEPWTKEAALLRADRERKLDRPPQVEPLGRPRESDNASRTSSQSERSSAAKSQASKNTTASVKTAGTVTVTERAKAAKAKHVVLPGPITTEAAKSVFSGVSNAGKRLQLASWYSSLLDSGSPILTQVANRMPELFNNPATSENGIKAADALMVIAPLVTSRVSEAMAAVPPLARAGVAGVVANVAKQLAEFSEPSAMQQASMIAIRYASAQRVLAVEPSVTPNEVMSFVGRERWSQVPSPASVVEDSLQLGIPLRDAFPVKYQPKGKDRTRQEWGFTATRATAEKEGEVRRTEVMRSIEERRHQWAHRHDAKGDLGRAFAMSYGTGEMHDADLASHIGAADVSEEQVSSYEVKKASIAAAMASELAGQTTTGAPKMASFVATPTEVATMREAADAAAAPPPTPDFASPSSDTSPAAELGSANTGEGMELNIANPLQSVQSESTVSTVGGLRTKVQSVMSGLPSMGFSRPSSS